MDQNMVIFTKYFAEFMVQNFVTVVRHHISRVRRYLTFSRGISVEFRSFHEMNFDLLVEFYNPFHSEIYSTKKKVSSLDTSCYLCIIFSYEVT